MTMLPTTSGASRLFPHAWLLLLGVWLAFGLARYTAPANFVDEDHQERQASYVVDLLRNGHWFAQEDQGGKLAGKPPLYTWLAAAPTALTGGRLTELALYTPALLATLGTMLLLWQWGRRVFGEWEGLLAALIYLFSPYGMRALYMARIDGLFACCVFLTAYAAYSAWDGRSRWLWFWLAATLATLAKGPLGLLLGGMGLLVLLVERQRAEKRPGATTRLVAEHMAGAALLLVVCGGWFLLAWREVGPSFWERLINQELVGHVVGGRNAGKPFNLGLYFKPAAYIFSRMLPWSLLGLVGLWRVWARPVADERQRRSGRFLATLFLGGLLVFTLAKHRRPDLMMPLTAPLALLAAVELSHWWRPANRRQAWGCALGVSAALWIGTTVYYHGPAWRQDQEVMRTAGTREVRRQLLELEATWADQHPERIITRRAAAGLQIMENTLNRQPQPQDIVAQLIAAKDPVLIVTGVGSDDDLDDAKLLQAALPPGFKLYEVIPWPETMPGVDAKRWRKTGKNFLRVFSTQPPPQKNS